MAHGWRSYLRSLECTACDAEFDADTINGVCAKCGKVLFARYDLAALREAASPHDFSARPWNLWRYHELLPVRNASHLVTLGEGMTPLLPVSQRVATRLGFGAGLV